MSIQQNFPAISPSLSLNFARSKTLDPRITFTRTSSATRVNGQGLIEVVPANAPRFDHSYDPVSGTVKSLGLLIEEQRTNSLRYSNDFSQNNWLKQNSHPVPTQDVVGPDGVSNSGWRFYRTATNQYLYQGVDGAGTHTLSVWVKSSAATGSFAMNAYNEIDGTTLTTFTATNEWQRFSITNSSTTTTNYYPCIPTNTNEDFYVWGAQLEQNSSFPTSYIPTSASTATRTADNASMVGENFSSWYNPNEGTIFADSLVKYNPNATRFVWGLSGGSIEHSLRQPHLTGLKFRAVIGGTITPSPGTGNNAVDGTTTKAAVAYNSTTGRLQVGTSSDEVTVSGIVYATEFTIGPHNGTIKNITYYPRRLSNAQLQTLTR